MVVGRTVGNLLARILRLEDSEARSSPVPRVGHLLSSVSFHRHSYRRPFWIASTPALEFKLPLECNLHYLTRHPHMVNDSFFSNYI